MHTIYILCSRHKQEDHFVIIYYIYDLTDIIAVYFFVHLLATASTKHKYSSVVIAACVVLSAIGLRCVMWWLQCS